MDFGREVLEKLTEGVSALERNANASEKLLEIATQETLATIDVGPPVCAGCGKLNPEVTLLGPELGSSGPLDDFLFKVESHCCNTSLYVGAKGYFTARSPELIVEAMKNEGRE